MKQNFKTSLMLPCFYLKIFFPTFKGILTNSNFTSHLKHNHNLQVYTVDTSYLQWLQVFWNFRRGKTIVSSFKKKDSPCFQEENQHPKTINVLKNICWTEDIKLVSQL